VQLLDATAALTTRPRPQQPRAVAIAWGSRGAPKSISVSCGDLVAFNWAGATKHNVWLDQLGVWRLGL
jgi:plastocyanin